MAVMSLAFFLAIERLPQHLTVALEFCGPLAVAALGARGWRALAWPLLAAAGIGLLVSGDARMAGGVDPAGIEVSMDKGILAIKGERAPAEGRFSRQERSYGSFHRRFSLPDSADADGITANGKFGVLEIVIPKKAETTPRRIAINH